jgi:hypothetical protein
MSQGNDFANYSSVEGSAVEGERTGSEDMWFVAVASDDIKQMTIDQLDEAFRLGVITAQTAVWTEGMETWAPLGEVADLESSESHDGASHNSAGHNSAGHNSAGHDSDGHGASALESAVHNSLPQNLVYQTSSERAREHAGFASGPSSFAPVTASLSPGGMSSAPAPLLQSSVPVALNVDEHAPPIARGRRWHPERWALAAAAIIGLGVTAYNNSDLFSASAASPAASVDSASGSKALAARPYEVGGVPGAVTGGSEDTGDSEHEAPAKAAKAKAADSTGEGSGNTTAPAAVKETLKSADAPLPSRADAKAEASSKENLKGSFSKAFNSSKRAPKEKAAKATKPRKASRSATKARAASKTPKKPGVPRGESAFDPLNGSLP